MVVPEEILTRMRRAAEKGPEFEEEEGLAIGVELARADRRARARHPHHADGALRRGQADPRGARRGSEANMTAETRMTAEARLRALLHERIAVLDGAMGTMIQGHRLDEAKTRGERFRNHPKDLKGNNDLLVLTQPAIVEGIHRQYLEAGADIVETNTFNAQAISLADYGMESLAYELNVAAARAARRAVDAHRAATGKDAFVAGAIGPTNRTLSLAVDVNDPGKRTHVFDQFVAAYTEQIRGLIDGGVDVLLFETVFDTLVLKAALFAALQHFDEAGRSVPLMVSVTITDKSGRTLSGQMVEAFWNSVSHAPLLAVGINCALGAKEMRPYIEELSRIAPVFLSAYPNAGLPNAFGGFDETPEIMSADIGGFAREGWVNIVGGCCGTTPAHIRAIADRGEGAAPAADSRPPSAAPAFRASSRTRSAPRRRSRSWASGRTSRGRRSSRSSSSRATTRARSPWRASRSTEARTSST